MNEILSAERAERLARLKSTFENRGMAEGEVLVPLGHPDVDGCLGGGIRTAALHEVFGDSSSGAASGFAALTLHLLLQHKSKRHLLWIRQDYSALEQGELYASGFQELGLDPSFLLLMRAADPTDALRASLEGLSSPHLGAVVLEIPGEPKILDLAATRRLTLAAQHHGVTALLLRLSAKRVPSACETRWLIKAAPSVEEEDWGAPRFDAELQRNRHGSTGHWVMEWSGDDFRPTHLGLMAAASSDRPHPARDMRRWA